MSRCFPIPSYLALCSSFIWLIEQWVFHFTSACSLLCKYCHWLCDHCCCNLTMWINPRSYNSLMFYTFSRITYLLCPTVLLGKWVRYDLTHFPKETWSGPWCHWPHVQVRKGGELWGRRPVSIFPQDWLPGRVISGVVLFHTCAPRIVLSAKKFHSILFKNWFFPLCERELDLKNIFAYISYRQINHLNLLFSYFIFWSF